MTDLGTKTTESERRSEEVTEFVGPPNDSFEEERSKLLRQLSERPDGNILDHVVELWYRNPDIPSRTRLHWTVYNTFLDEAARGSMDVNTATRILATISELVCIRRSLYDSYEGLAGSMHLIGEGIPLPGIFSVQVRPGDEERRQLATNFEKYSGHRGRRRARSPADGHFRAIPSSQ